MVILHLPFLFLKANLAQLVEQRIRNASVAGSNPAVGSKNYSGNQGDNPDMYSIMVTCNYK
jgi:hypothetical protein